MTSSLISGQGGSGLLFEYENYQGHAIPFGEMTTIKCFKDDEKNNKGKEKGEKSLDKLASSLMFGADKCVILNYRTKDQINNDLSSNFIFCKDKEKFDKSIPKNVDYLRIYIYRQDISITLYSEENFKGTEWIIAQPGIFYENFDQIPLTNFKSVRYLKPKL